MSATPSAFTGTPPTPRPPRTRSASSPPSTGPPPPGYWGEHPCSCPAGLPPVAVINTPHQIALAGQTTVSPIGRAQDHAAEVRPPSGILVRAWDVLFLRLPRPP